MKHWQCSAWGVHLLGDLYPVSKGLQKAAERTKHYVSRLKVNAQWLAASVENASRWTDWRILDTAAHVRNCLFCTQNTKVWVVSPICVTCAWVDVLYLVHLHEPVPSVHTACGWWGGWFLCVPCVLKHTFSTDNTWSFPLLWSQDSWGDYYWAFLGQTPSW